MLTFQNVIAMHESNGIDIIITLVLPLQTQDIYMSMLIFQNGIAMQENDGIDIIRPNKKICMVQVTP